MTTLPLLSRASRRPQATACTRQAPAIQRVRKPGGGATARTWEDLQLDIVGRGRSDEPRLPAHQVDALHPWGAPRSWGLLIEEPQRPAWVLRLAAGTVSLILGIAAAVSNTVAGVIATTVAGFGELLTIAAHLLGVVGADGSLGTVGRVLAVGAFVAAVVRLAWRFGARTTDRDGSGW